MSIVMNTDSSPRPIRLWQLISPALPVGAFHYSQGLEQAINRGWIKDAGTAESWIAGVLERCIGSVDLPIICKIYNSWSAGDKERVKELDELCRACRETSELRDEEAQMGLALCDLAGELDETLPAEKMGFTAAFAVIAVNNQILLEDALNGYAWAWCENQVLAAVKLVPLGHRMGQRILRDLGPVISDAAANALQCGAIGVTAPGFVIASASHETQYSRIFRS